MKTFTLTFTDTDGDKMDITSAGETLQATIESLKAAGWETEKITAAVEVIEPATGWNNKPVILSNEQAAKINAIIKATHPRRKK